MRSTPKTQAAVCIKDFVAPFRAVRPSMSLIVGVRDRRPSVRNQIGGPLGRLGGATKELPANLDIQKGTPKSQFLSGIPFFGAPFGHPNFASSVRASVRASAPASVQIPSGISFLKTPNR